MQRHMHPAHRHNTELENCRFSERFGHSGSGIAAQTWQSQLPSVAQALGEEMGCSRAMVQTTMFAPQTRALIPKP